MPGTLYVVATPIGNLEDITLRALRVLREADVIACEDTRQTRKLLDHHGIATRLLSYHDRNEEARAAQLSELLREGQSVALVSDAGTPLISDPGYRIVHIAAAEGLPVVPIPGASAVLAALSASGLPTDAFRFCGFLPPKPGARRKMLAALSVEDVTLVFLESPHRILESLGDIGEILPSRPVVLARELTKLHEEFLRGTAAEIHARLAMRDGIKGEITLLVGKPEAPPVEEGSLADAVLMLEKTGLNRMDAIKQVAHNRGVPKREVYRRMEELKDS